jgi:hypothetical protein
MNAHRTTRMAPRSRLARSVRLSIGVVALGGIPPRAGRGAESVYDPAADADSMHETTRYSWADAGWGSANR